MTDTTIEHKIERVEEIQEQLQQAETMNPADAKDLRDVAMDLLADLEADLQIADGNIERRE